MNKFTTDTFRYEYIIHIVTQVFFYCKVMDVPFSYSDIGLAQMTMQGPCIYRSKILVSNHFQLQDMAQKGIMHFF